MMHRPSNINRSNIPVPKTVGEQLHSMFEIVKTKHGDAEAVAWVDRLGMRKSALRNYWLNNGYDNLFEAFFNK